MSAYCTPGEALTYREEGDHLVLSFYASSEDHDWVEGEGWLATLTPLRSALLGGDERCLYPGWTAFSRPGVYLAAMGQAFFSPSIGMAIFVTYGSYMAERQRIPVAAIWSAVGDSLLAVIAGVPSALSFGTLGGVKLAGMSVLAVVDYAASNLLLPIGALLVGLFVGWKWRPEQARASSDLGDSPLRRIWLGLVRYFAPPAILMILLRGLDVL